MLSSSCLNDVLLELLRGHIMRGKNEKEIVGNRMKGIDGDRV